MKLPVWDLSDLFRSAQDPQIVKTYRRCEEQTKKFVSRYKGRVANLVKDPSLFKRFLEEYEVISQEAIKPSLYASLLFAETSTDPARGAFSQKTRTRYVAISQELLFVELEMLKLPAAKLWSLGNQKQLARYRNFLKKLLLEKDHVLDEGEERILSDKSLTSSGAFMRLFQEELGGKSFEVKLKGKRRRLSQVELLDLLYDSNRSIRREAALAHSKGLKEESRRLTFIYNTIIQDKAITDKYRRYSSPEEARHIANETEQPVVDVMVGEVVRGYPIVQRYYNLKRKLLKVDKLYDYDRYAPIGKDSEKVTFKQAQSWILDSFENFSAEYAAIAKEFFDRGWIDADKRPGKRAGAFCSFATPDLHPYVFVNFTGSMREVFTLAHELGHAVHAYLMRGQGLLNFSPPLTIAETASVFAEMLVFDHLKSEITQTKQKRALLLGKLEGIFATVFRQVALYRFEQDVHQAYRKQGELSCGQISSFWRNRQSELYQKSVTLTPGQDLWWSYIPHFMHTPFYVYAYAFGELMTLALYARYKKEGQRFVGAYLDLLKAGSSQSPAELVAPLGAKLDSRSFWRGGVKMISDLADEARVIARR